MREEEINLIKEGKKKKHFLGSTASATNTALLYDTAKVEIEVPYRTVPYRNPRGIEPDFLFGGEEIDAQINPRTGKTKKQAAVCIMYQFGAVHEIRRA